MYSVVLATMLAAGSTTPAWHTRSCHSCYTCYTSCSCYSSYSCYGCSSCCSYYSCHSCYSSHRIFPIFHHHCYGCTTYVYSSCSSCSYCSHPVVVYGCSGCCTSAVVVAPATPRVIDVRPGGGEVEMLRKQLEELRNKLKQTEKTPGKKNPADEEVAAPVSSRVTVTLPSDARMWVENVECPLTTSVRSFNTPLLNANQQYFYNLKVEVVRDGRTVSELQRVVITPGQEARVDFNSSTVVGTAAR
jgi:uncharacterized protein (TIGR03000 family)